MRLLPYLLIGMFVLGVLTFLISLQQLRRRRTGAYWRLRRKAGDRGGKLFLLSIGLMVGSVVLTVITGLGTLAYKNINRYLSRGPDDLYGIVLSPDVLMTATGEAIARLMITATPVVANTAVPPTPAPPTIAAATLTATPVPPTATFTATLTPTPTFTPTVTPSPTANFAILLKLTPIFNTTPRPATPGYRLSLDSAGDGVDGDGETLGHEFMAGIKRVYLFMSFDKMENGVAWSRVLYREGLPIQGNTLLWSLGASGNSYFFFGDEVGYTAGNYQVRLFVGDQEVSRYAFDVKP